MAELTQKERLQPSLLDRLTDDNPLSSVESRDSRVLGVQKLREYVLRDLAWLLNTDNLESSIDFEFLPEARNSVINYGVPTTSGIIFSGLDIVKLEQNVALAIQAFEPRILKNTLRIRGVANYVSMERSSLTFEIEGELWAQPIPQKMYLRTELDLDTGKVSIRKVD
jgi:type VI secretion system protein ImpF